MYFLAIFKDAISMDIVWLVVALVCYLLKLVTKHHIFSCAAVGALIAAFCVFAEVEMRPLIEIAIFVVATLLMALFIQPYVLQQHIENRRIDLPHKEVIHNQEEATVSERIDNAVPTGRVRIGQEEFTARSATGSPLELNEKVRVVDSDGPILIVL